MLNNILTTKTKTMHINSTTMYLRLVILSKCSINPSIFWGKVAVPAGLAGYSRHPSHQNHFPSSAWGTPRFSKDLCKHLCLGEASHGLRFWGADLHTKPLLKVTDWGGQQKRIICKKQRRNPEAPKLATESTEKTLDLILRTWKQLWLRSYRGHGPYFPAAHSTGPLGTWSSVFSRSWDTQPSPRLPPTGRRW